MRSATSIVILALLVAPALSAPLGISKPSTVKPASSSGSGIGAAVAGGAASAAVGNLLSKIEGLFSRGEFDNISARDFKTTIASLSPEDKATVKAALISKVSTLKDTDLQARGALGSLGGAALGGASSALVGNLLSEIESLFRRTVTEEPPVEEPPASTSSKSGGSSTGSDLLGAAVGGASGAAVGNILDKIEGFFGFKRGVFNEQVARRDLASIKQGMQGLSDADRAKVKAALIAKVSTLKNSDLVARGALGSLGGAALGGASSALVGNLLSEIESLFRRTVTEEPPVEEPPASTPSKSGGSSTSGQLLGAAAGGASGAVVSNLLDKIEGFFGFKRGVFNEQVARRDLASIKAGMKGLSDADKATVKAALINKVSTLKNTDLQARGTLGSLGGAALGGASSALVGNLLSEIESLFRRTVTEEPPVEEPPASTPSKSGGSSTGSDLLGAAVGGASGAAVGNILDKIEGFFGFKRGVFDEQVAKRDFASIKQGMQGLSDVDKAKVKAALIAKVSTLKNSNSARGTLGSLGAAAAGGAASGLVGNLLSEIESLFRRSDFEARDFKSTIASLSPEDKATVKAVLIQKVSSLKDSDLQARGALGSLGGAALGGASSALVGNLLSEIESLFRREDLLARSDMWNVNELD